MVVVFGCDCVFGGCWAGGALELLLFGLEFGLWGLVGSVGCLGGQGCLVMHDACSTEWGQLILGQWPGH